MLMIHIHFTGCQYIKSSYFFEHQIVSQQLSTQFFLYVLYNCIENSKTTVYFYDHEMKNYLPKHIKLLIVKQYNYTELTLLDVTTVA